MFPGFDLRQTDPEQDIITAGYDLDDTDDLDRYLSNV